MPSTRLHDDFPSCRRYPRILADLEFAGSGGVLVVARLEKIQTDSGVYRNLISEQLDYVGIGANDFEAEMANIDNKGKPFYTMKDGYNLYLEKSTAYWFSKPNRRSQH